MYAINYIYSKRSWQADTGEKMEKKKIRKNAQSNRVAKYWNYSFDNQHIMINISVDQFFRDYWGIFFKFQWNCPLWWSWNNYQSENLNKERILHSTSMLKHNFTVFFLSFTSSTGLFGIGKLNKKWKFFATHHAVVGTSP